MDYKLLQELISLRHKLHANPELSGKETNTSKVIYTFLKTCVPTTLLTNVGGYGVLAIFDSKKKGETILFRADMDALPITETNTFKHQSLTKGISHKCGHDGHTTTLLGFAKLLSKNPPKKGKIILLFQPAEETGEGANRIINDPKFKNLNPNYVFAFHNIPGETLHQVIIKNNSFTAAVKSIIIKIYGKNAHAAEPEKGINPALSISEIIQTFETLSNNDPKSENFSIITPIHITMGEIAYGTAAGYGELRFTLRTWTQEKMDILSSTIITILQKISIKHNVKIETEWTEEFKATKNNNDAINIILLAAKHQKLEVQLKKEPFKFGEDFGLFTQQFKGAMFGIGAGKHCAPLHNPEYDFPDKILPTTIQLFHQISLQLLN